VYPGVLHNAFLDVGIPAFTPEIGAARVLNLEMIQLFVEGTMNVLKHHGIVAGPMGRTGRDVRVFVGDSAFPIMAVQGGLVEHLVKLNDKVEAGQKVAIQRNSFRRSGCGIFQQRGWRSDGSAQRSNVRARESPDIYPFQ
jgi:predicted deacylase